MKNENVNNFEFHLDKVPLYCVETETKSAATSAHESELVS